jgi:hypothetical protein
MVKRLPAPFVVLALAAGTAVVPAVSVSQQAAADSPAGTTYSVGTPVVSGITDGSSQAPYNSSQGDSGSTAYPSSDLFPTYTPGGPTTGSGSTAEPNLAVYPGASSGTDGNSPYPSGTVGTPGPLSGYCGSGNNTTEASQSPVRQPVGSTLPMAPYYFPHVVRNTDGSLTGYFDWRPKDGDEAIVSARSTDNGHNWTYEGEGLEQNPGYCPNADINDDGQGHPNVLTVGGSSYLYTLQRPAGDGAGVSLLAHSVDPTATNPLASVPASEKVGIDANSFATASDAVSSAASTINVQATNSSYLQNGAPTSLAELVPGPVVDLTQTPVPTAASVITCTGVTATSLTGCTNTAGLTVQSGDLIEQVIATVSASNTPPVVIPAGPNTTTGDGGYAKLTVNVINALTMTTLNANAPSRVYLDGVPVYCNQSNANPTNKIENCTTGPNHAALTVAAGDPITSDPIVPASATQTTGLIAPDGIVGVLPSYPGVPAGATAIAYTEKVLGYYITGTTTNASAATFSSTISFNPNANTSSDLPSVINSSNPVTLEMGDSTKSSIIPVTCTGLTLVNGTPSTPAVDSFTGCTVPSADTGDKYSATSWIGTAASCTTSSSTLGLTGEGSTSTAKLFKNNEDLTILRVAYTTDGLNFSSAGLANGGVISGSSNGASNYQDLTNPGTTASPSNLNAYAASGTADATEMRWVGSQGSVVTNPDGTYGLFLNGAWCADGDSDAYNQVFYSSSSDGQHWTIPTTVVSTDYTFSASLVQDQALAGGTNAPLGVSAYYSGRAYGPTVVPNGDGTDTLIFSGYRSPKPIVSAGTVLGTGATPWTVGATDPALYRDILAVTLTPTTTPRVATTTTLTSDPGSAADGDLVTYTAHVNVVSPGTGTPTGTVSFADDGSGIGDVCATMPVIDGTATCTAAAGGNESTYTVTATYSGDGNYAGSSDLISEVGYPALDVTATSATPAFGAAGQTLDLQFAVTNKGASAVAGLAVTDSLGSSVTCPDSSLAAGDSETCTASYTTTQADVDAGSVSDTAGASATVNGVTVTSAASTVTVPATLATTALSLTTSSTTSSYSGAGQSVSFEYDVSNSGTTTLSGVSVTDEWTALGPLGPLGPLGISCPSPTLAPGASETCTASYTTTQADVDAGSITDTATASATDPFANPVASNESSTTVGEAAAFTSGSTATFTEGTPGSFTVTTVGGPDAPIITASGLPAGFTLTDNRDGTATVGITSWGYGCGETGTFPVTLYAQDLAGTATQSLTLSVNQPAAAKPTFLSADSATATVAEPFTFTVAATCVPLPAISEVGVMVMGLHFTDNHDGTATLSGTPAVTTAGVHTFTFVAKSTAGTTKQTFVLTIDRAPTFTSGKAVTATTGTPFSYTVKTAAYPAPTITYTSSPPLPSGVTLVDQGNGTAILSGTPPVGSQGLYIVTMNADNGVLFAHSMGNNIISLRIDQGPAITSGNAVTVARGVPMTPFAVTATGYPAPAVGATGLPYGLRLVRTPTGATLSGTPSKAVALGDHTVTITARNSLGTTTQTFTITITP